MAWVSIAPFATPVVPPVYWRTATSVRGSTSANLRKGSLFETRSLKAPAIPSLLTFFDARETGEGALGRGEVVGQAGGDDLDVEAPPARLDAREEVVPLHDVVRGDEDGGARVPELELELLRLVERAAGDHDPAGLQDAEVG